MTVMQVVLIGSGAIGTLYGGWLLSGGADVGFVARGARFDQIRAHGIILSGSAGEIVHRTVAVTHAATDLPLADVLIFAVKTYDLDLAARAARHALAPGGLVVGLQNGVDAAAMLGSIFDPGQVMVGPVYSAATLTADGTVRYGGQRNDVAIGNAGGVVHPLAEPLVEYWRKAGVEASISGDIQASLWTKFLFLATNAALTCLSRQPAGVVYHDPLLLDLAERSIAEIAAVAVAQGVKLAPDAPAAALAILKAFPPDVVASMRQDLDAGQRLELEAISGTIVRLGRKHGLATPVHDVAYACLKPFADGA
ncbi:MAG: ketopantoate reductase family protein [Sphingomonas bacterium]|nr:ketopantoate reductase family protein [Sphingomonas bacterium]